MSGVGAARGRGGATVAPLDAREGEAFHSPRLRRSSLFSCPERGAGRSFGSGAPPDLQDHLARIVVRLEGFAADQRVAYVTELALEEVLSNGIRHGHAQGGRHEIALVLRVGDRVELEVVDDGLEFDPTRAPDAELEVPLAERRVGGLGIQLVRVYASELHYERREGRDFLWLRI